MYIQLIGRMLAEPDNRVLIELLRLALDNSDSLAWASLLKLQDRIGDTFFEYVYAYAKQMRVTFASALLILYRDTFPDGPRSCPELLSVFVRYWNGLTG